MALSKNSEVAKIITEEEVADFHKKYVNLIEQVLNNPQIKLGEITI